MRLALASLFVFAAATAHAASDRQPAPVDAPGNPPPQFTRFTKAELTRGFMALAFGSDLRVGGGGAAHIRKFDRPVRIHVMSAGSTDRTVAMKKIVEEYAQKVPALQASLTDDENAADIVVRLIDEKNFRSALEAAYGRKVARDFIRKTDPQCMTGLQADNHGIAKSAASFVIVDRGEPVFLDCAYHELLHAFGLSNHDQRNRFTTLNQNRLVGYLAAYDRALLALLYNERIRPGMTRPAVRALLPRLIESLPEAAAPKRGG